MKTRLRGPTPTRTLRWTPSRMASAEVSGLAGTSCRPEWRGGFTTTDPAASISTAPGVTTWGCFGHRDNILDYPTSSELAAGVADSPGGNSAAAVFSDQYTDFNFLWSTELSAGYPQGLPSSFTVAPPTVTSVTVQRSGVISITGTDLDTGTVYFSEVPDAYELNCSSPDACTVAAPSNLAANTIYNVYVLNPAGLSAQSAADEYTTKPRL